mgnify:CR=1 FL=1
MAKERQIRIRVEQNPRTTISVSQLQEHVENQRYIVERIVDSSYSPERNEAIFDFKLRPGHEMQDQKVYEDFFASLNYNIFTTNPDDESESQGRVK